MDEYLTILEVAARLKVSAKTVRNKMAAGVFKRGVHYFSPHGLGPRFEWSAVVAWLREKEIDEGADGIPLKQGSVLKIPLTEKKRKHIRPANGL